MSSHPTSASSSPRAGQPATGRPDLRLLRGQGTSGPEQLPLALEWEVAPGIPAVPPVPAGLRLVTDEPDTRVEDLPDPRLWTSQLARAIAEVCVGERPVGQLTRWVSRPELAKISRRAMYVSRHPSARAQKGVTRKRVVKAVRACPVAPGVVETSAVLVGADRAQAIAIRLEAIGGRWLATAIEMN